MNDDLPRRRLLGLLGSTTLLGTTSLAGCSALPFEGNERDEAERIPGGDLQAIATDEGPAIPRTLPIDIETTYLEASVERVRSHLSSVPTPLDETEVPNGAIREELGRVHERTEEMLESAEAAQSPFEAMETLRGGRGQARTLSAAWEAIDEGLTRESVGEDITRIEDARTDLLGRWRYVGEDPVRAALVHATIEQYVASARRLSTGRSAPDAPRPENPIDVGEFAGDLERALAAVEDAAYCYDRFTSSLAEPTDLLSVLDVSARTLVAEVARRGGSLSDVEPDDTSSLVDRDVSDTPAAAVLERFYWDISDPTYPAEQRAAGRPARAIVLAHGTLARFRAFESLRGEIDDGESFVVETAGDVRSIRSAAVDAVTSASTESSVQGLTNRELSRLSSRLAGADQRLVRFGDSVSPTRLDHVVSEYVTVRAVADALPPTSEAVATVIEASRS